MSGPLYLAWRYLVFHRMKAAILVLSITRITFLPAGLNVLVGESAAQLRARAEATPLLLGAKGSPLELALSSLYFDSRAPEPVAFGEVDRVRASGLAAAIPLHVGFRAGTHPGLIAERVRARRRLTRRGFPVRIIRGRRKRDCVRAPDF